MPVKFANESEAFLSVLTLVAGADQSGSLEERDFLFKKVKGLAIFGNPSTADFAKLLGKVTDAVYEGVAQKDGEFTTAGNFCWRPRLFWDIAPVAGHRVPYGLGIRADFVDAYSAAN